MDTGEENDGGTKEGTEQELGYFAHFGMCFGGFVACIL